jgi:SAM-dependent methyltransferase
MSTAHTTETTSRPTSTPVHEEIRARYGELARSKGEKSCCGPSCCGGSKEDVISSDLYDADETREIPEEAVKASLGCGNPTALVDLKPGQTVLDLGSGGGIDVLLSARRVGPTGFVYGLDMTGDMLALARANQARAGATNVQFLEGQIESIPLPDASVDVIISNCVINLSPDKDAVLREAFRVLKPGGRFAVSDVVVRGEVPADVRQSMELWVGCIAGALEEGEYVRKLEAAGFEGAAIEAWRVYDASDARAMLEASGIDPDRAAEHTDGTFISAFVRARKPAIAGTPALASPAAR